MYFRAESFKFFGSYFGKLMISKIHSEIYWPLTLILLLYVWKGERYTSCTEADSHGLEWCSTLTDVLDNHLTGYWGNCDSLENELAQVMLMSLIYKTTKFNLKIRIKKIFCTGSKNYGQILGGVDQH